MIRLKSKALQSELVALRDSCEIKEKEEYFVIHSLRNPNFHWGNFLIFNEAPKESDLPKWEEYSHIQALKGEGLLMRLFMVPRDMHSKIIL